MSNPLLNATIKKTNKEVRVYKLNRSRNKQTLYWDYDRMGSDEEGREFVESELDFKEK